MSAGMPDIWQPVSGRRAGPMSALSPKADIARRRKHVRLVPLADIRPSALTMLLFLDWKV